MARLEDEDEDDHFYPFTHQGRHVMPWQWVGAATVLVVMAYVFVRILINL